MSYTSEIETYKNTLKGLLEAIPFESGTLSGSVFTYKKSKMTKPETELQIYSRPLQSRYLQNRDNKRYYNLIVRIICRIEDREQKAWQDMEYIEEQVISVIENNSNNPNWNYEANDNIVSTEVGGIQGFIVRDIAVPAVWKYVRVNIGI